MNDIIKTPDQVIAELHGMSAQFVHPTDTYFASMADVVERLQAEHRHCDHCGGTWLDDGINAGCYCREVGRLQADIDALRETLAWVRSMHADVLEEIQRLQAAINTIRTTYARTVPTHIAEGPYPVAGLEQVLVGDWELIQSLQTGASPPEVGE